MFSKIAAYVGMCVMLVSCSGYNKLLKSSDLELKYKKALEYYGNEKYFKAYPLIEELVTIYRGTARAEELYYMYAYTDYFLEDYLLASHRFSQFVKTFPTSKYVEECEYMSAYCHYLMSPEFSLDQENTYLALTELQLFINRNPNSSRIDTCNTLIDELEYKLEQKAYESAKQYFRMDNFKASITTFENLLLDYPDTEYREEAYFTIFKAHYLLFKKSVEAKKLERIDSAIKSYITFVDRFPKSIHVREAESIYTELQLEKQQYEQKTVKR